MFCAKKVFFSENATFLCFPCRNTCPHKKSHAPKIRENPGKSGEVSAFFKSAPRPQFREKTFQNVSRIELAA